MNDEPNRKFTMSSWLAAAQPASLLQFTPPAQTCPPLSWTRASPAVPSAWRARSPIILVMKTEIKGLQLLEEMRRQAEKFGVKFVQDKAIGADLMSEEKSIYGNAGVYPARAIVIATGAMGRGRRVEGEERLLGRGISYCATCDAAFYRDQVVAVAGNSDEAVEEALFLTKFVSQVHFFSPTEALKVPR